MGTFSGFNREQILFLWYFSDKIKTLLEDNKEMFDPQACLIKYLFSQMTCDNRRLPCFVISDSYDKVIRKKGNVCSRRDLRTLVL